MHASPFSRRMTVGGTRICPAAGGWRRKSIRRCQPLRFLRFSGQRFAEAAGPAGVVARFDVAARIGAYGDYTAAVLPAQVAAEGFVMGLQRIGYPCLSIAAGGEEEGSFRCSEGVVQRIETVDNPFQLGRHTEIVERGDECYRIRFEEVVPKVDHVVLLNALRIMAAAVVAGTARFYSAGGCVETDDLVAGGFRSGGEFIGQQHRGTPAVRTACNDEYLHDASY